MLHVITIGGIVTTPSLFGTSSCVCGYFVYIYYRRDSTGKLFIDKNNPVAKSQIHDIVGYIEIKATTQIML